jgi:hypothetical protein
VRRGLRCAGTLWRRGPGWGDTGQDLDVDRLTFPHLEIDALPDLPAAIAYLAGPLAVALAVLGRKLPVGPIGRNCQNYPAHTLTSYTIFRNYSAPLAGAVKHLAGLLKPRL